MIDPVSFSPCLTDSGISVYFDVNLSIHHTSYINPRKFCLTCHYQNLIQSFQRFHCIYRCLIHAFSDTWEKKILHAKVEQIEGAFEWFLMITPVNMWQNCIGLFLNHTSHFVPGFVNDALVDMWSYHTLCPAKKNSIKVAPWMLRSGFGLMMSALLLLLLSDGSTGHYKSQIGLLRL